MTAALLCAFGAVPEASALERPAWLFGKKRTASRDSGLEQLKERSAAERWDQLKDRWKEPQPAPAVSETEVETDVTESLAPVDAPAEELYEAPVPVAPAPSITRIAQETPPPAALPDDSEFQFDTIPEEDEGPLELVNRPQDLKPITDIRPFFAYEPDPDVHRGDRCTNLCPRPAGCPPRRGEYGPECPEEVSFDDIPFGGRYFPNTQYTWLATNFFHYPLYFEDVPLERYGHTHHELIQPFASVGKFGLQLVGLPYQMTIDPVHKCMYTLGFYRPGECAPKLHEQVPFSLKAAAVQAGVTTGLIYAIP